VQSADIQAAIERGRETAELFSWPVKTIEAPLNLAGMRLGHLDFRDMTFAAPVNFRGARFSGVAWFDRARFLAQADFSFCEFHLDARFDSVRFEHEAYFSTAEFCGGAIFDRTLFEQGASFDRCLFYAGLSFAKASLSGLTSFRNAESYGGAWLDQVQFNNLDMDGFRIHGRTYARSATYRTARGRMAVAASRQFDILGDLRA
jgi:uncharacterized protein YjbI with pentapeptide repeats